MKFGERVYLLSLLRFSNLRIKVFKDQAQHDKEEFNSTLKRKLQNLGLDISDVAKNQIVVC